MNQINLGKIKVGAEIGCGDWRSCEIKKHDIEKVYLFEPNSLLSKDVFQKTKGNPKYQVFSCAIDNKSYIGKLYYYGYSSFLKGSNSFTNLWKEDGKSREAEKFYEKLSDDILVLDAHILDKDIELLILTCEGCELNILNRLEFRPKFIQVKYHCQTPEQYQYTDKITQWFAQNSYKGILLDRNELGTYFNVIFIK